jgi:hypothetical protein
MLDDKDLRKKVSSPHVANLLTMWRTYLVAIEHPTALEANQTAAGIILTLAKHAGK